MDEHNVHHFWGISPALDLGSLLPTGDGVAVLPVDQPIRILQVAPYDARHTLATVCRATRHPLIQRQQQPVQLVVWEDSPEGLARHLLLLAVLLDGALLPRERGQMLLELHGNALLRERAAAYLDEKARQLEALVVGLAGGGARGGSMAEETEAESRGLVALGGMVDLSLLKYQEKDLLVEALQKWRNAVVYDMVKAWDARARKWYGDRYDFRRNLVDWDYHMRLQPAGTPGQDPSHGSIIHFHHFRHWRMHGVAHELRDSHYNQPNRSLLSTAYGRTKEFKDRTGRDVGRSVSAWGFWADSLNGPYHCFGTLAEEVSFYSMTNKQFSRTAVDLAEHNVAALLHELRTGERLVLADSAQAPRAKVARGPTSIEDLTAAAAADAAAAATAASAAAADAAAAAAAANAAAVDAAAVDAAAAPGTGQGGGKEQGPETANGAAGEAAEGSEAVKGSEAAEGSGAASTAAGGVPPESSRAGMEARAQTSASQAEPSAAAAAAGETKREGDGDVASSGPPPSAASQSSGPDIPRYTSGGRAQVAKAIAAAAAAVADGAEGSVEEGASAPSSSAAGAGEEDVAVAQGDAPPATSQQDDAARERMAAEEAAERAEEARLDAAGRQRASSRFRIQLVTGDLAKGVTGRAKYGDAFSVLSVGHRHMHMLTEEYGLLRAAAPGAVLVAENARHLLQLNKEQAALFVTKMDEMAAATGWRNVESRPDGVTEASEVYDKPRA